MLYNEIFQGCDVTCERVMREFWTNAGPGDMIQALKLSIQ